MLKVSMYWERKISELDPARISFANEAILLDNLYGNLITYDSAGQLVTDLADDFFWNGKSYVFTFGDKLSSKGQRITSLDAGLSLKRLILLNRNTHGKLHNYLCDVEIRNLEDSCAGILISENTLTLTPSTEVVHDLLLSLLTGIDYKVIPAAALDKKFPFSIQDYSNTSGAYSIEPGSPEGAVSFVSNKNYYNYSTEMPQKWQLVPSKLVENISRLGQDIDVITTASYINWDVDSSELEIFSTQPISNELLVFSQLAQNNLTLEERSFIIAMVRRFFEGKMEKNKVPTLQFFPQDSVGYLGHDKERLIESRLSKIVRPGRNVKIGVPKSVVENLGATSDLLENGIEIVNFELGDFQKTNSEVDAIFVSTDSAFQEDISLLEYNISFGIFGTTKIEGEEWSSKYLRMNRADRISALKEFHFNSLYNLKIGPLFSLPYFAASSNKWRFEMSRINASTHLWKMRKKHPTEDQPG